jgi:glycosyltransferase involved in cell wall biosynthesis
MTLITLVARERPSAVLAHMSPVYAVLAAPIARNRRIPLVLWFTHWRRSRLLAVAERVSTRVISVDRSSFPLPSRKVIAVGHGIEVGPPIPPRLDDGAMRVLALGRTSPAKGLETIVAAVGQVDGAELEIRGPSLTDEERRERERLVSLGAVVADPVPYGAVRSVYETTDALVSNMRAGALDKVVFEAAAVGLPVLVASHGFESLVRGIEPPLLFVQDDAHSLAARIRALGDAGAVRRQEIGLELRARVARDHSVEHWADAVIEAIR